MLRLGFAQSLVLFTPSLSLTPSTMPQQTAMCRGKRGLMEGTGTCPRLCTSQGKPPGATPGRAELVLPGVNQALLTAPQVGGHVLQHLDLSDGLSPGEVHHEHPVA